MLLHLDYSIEENDFQDILLLMWIEMSLGIQKVFFQLSLMMHVQTIMLLFVCLLLFVHHNLKLLQSFKNKTKGFVFHMITFIHLSLCALL
jgi:hypothetical protein